VGATVPKSRAEEPKVLERLWREKITTRVVCVCVVVQRSDVSGGP